MAYELKKDTLEYIEETKDELMTLLKELCGIPSPSGKEDARAAFIKQWFDDNNCKGSYIDSIKNVIFPVNADDKCPLVIFCAHTDTVFPDMEPMPIYEKDGRLYCPGVGDDTSNVAALMLAARHFKDRDDLPENLGFLFVANSCEEASGGGMGVAELMRAFGNRTVELFTFDGSYGAIPDHLIGTANYNVTVQGEGGHARGGFGNRNAIHYASNMISTLYAVKAPEGVTYNIGLIEGGTSVNSIPSTCTFTYEIRATEPESLTTMEEILHKLADSYVAMGVPVEITLNDKRPSPQNVNPLEMERIVNRAKKAAFVSNGTELKTMGATSDANYPSSLGIPATGMGIHKGMKGHSREESIDIAWMPNGYRYMFSVIYSYFEDAAELAARKA